jgi:hypothetical protein
MTRRSKTEAEAVREHARVGLLVGRFGAWHSRVMADELVSHAFSHGFHPQHSERLAASWAEALGPHHLLRHLWRRNLGRADPQRERP